MNTTTLANQLDVSPKTIRRWIQFFNLQFTKNEHGHFQFKEEDLLLFQTIKEYLAAGKSLKEIIPLINTEGMESNSNMEQHPQSNEYDLLFNKIFQQLKIQEKKISEKADEVVSYQILHHRREIEELQSKITILENKVHELQKQQTNGSTEPSPQPMMEEKRKRKGLVRAVFG